MCLILALALTACAGTPPPCPTRTQVLRVDRPVHIEIPDELIAPLQVPALPEDLENRDLEDDIALLEDVIDHCQHDRAQIRQRQRERQEREP